MTIHNMMVRATAALAVVALVACAGGGGGGGSSLPSQPGSPQQTQGNAQIVVTIGGSTDSAAAAIAKQRAAQSGGARPQYVSPSTLGVQVTSSPAGVSQAFDVSSGSPLCTSGSPRTCTLAFNVNAGSYTFTMNLYDAIPVSGSIPGTAHLLGASSLSKTILPSQANVLNFYIGAVISTLGIGGGATFASLPADGAVHSFGYVVVAKDAGGNGVTGGTNDPYSTPITVTLTESGGSGHSYLVLNGANSGLTATLTKSSDTLSLHYDGGGVAGYGTNTKFAASGAPNSTLQVSPLYASTTNVTVYRPYDSTHPLSAALTINEASAPQPVAISGSACGTKVSVLPTSIASGNGSTTVTAGPLDSVSCTLTVSDAYGSSVNVGATVDPAYTAGTIVTHYGGTLYQPIGITLGPDGNMWFAEAGYQFLDQLNTTTGTITTVVKMQGSANVALGTTLATLTGCGFPPENFAPWGVTKGPDGNLWVTGQISGAGCTAEDAVLAFNTSGTLIHDYAWARNGAGPRWYGYSYVAGGVGGYYLGQSLVASDNNIWALACNDSINNVEVTKLTTAGALTEYAPPVAIPCNGGYSNGNMIVGPDGNLWFSYSSGITSGGVVKVQTSGAMTAYPILSNNYPWQIASGSDGNIWYDVGATTGLYRMATSGTLLDSSPYVNPGTQPGFLYPTFNGGIFATGLPQAGSVSMAGVVTTGTAWPASPGRFQAAGTGVDDFMYVELASFSTNDGSIYKIEP